MLLRPMLSYIFAPLYSSILPNIILKLLHSISYQIFISTSIEILYHKQWKNDIKNAPPNQSVLPSPIILPLKRYISALS